MNGHVLLTDIQRSIRRHHNPVTLLVSVLTVHRPFLATANGQVYTQDLRADDRGKKWSYLMEATADAFKVCIWYRQVFVM